MDVTDRVCGGGLGWASWWWLTFFEWVENTTYIRTENELDKGYVFSVY